MYHRGRKVRSGVYLMKNNVSPDEIMDWWNIESGNEGGGIAGIVGNGGNDRGDVISLVHADVWTSKATESKDVEGLSVVISISSNRDGRHAILATIVQTYRCNLHLYDGAPKNAPVCMVRNECGASL